MAVDPFDEDLLSMDAYHLDWREQRARMLEHLDNEFVRIAWNVAYRAWVGLDDDRDERGAE